MWEFGQSGSRATFFIGNVSKFGFEKARMGWLTTEAYAHLLFIECQVLINGLIGCAVKGAGPQRGYTRPGTGSLHPVAIRAAVEATKLLKPLV
jgi:hypothetical protein